MEDCFNNLSQKYEENTGLKALVNLIPGVGGSIDTLIAGKAVQMKTDRIRNFMQDVSSRLSQIESSVDPASEEFVDFAFSVLEAVSRTRSQSKKENFASIFIKQFSKNSDYNDAEFALRLLRDLEEIHISVLSLAISAPICTAPFPKLPLISIENTVSRTAGQTTPLVLFGKINGATPMYLDLACAELEARRLLTRTGATWSEPQGNLFMATELAHWFKEWVSV